MGWLSIIMALLAALPELVELIKSILDLIRKKPAGQRMGLRRDLGKLCRGHLKAVRRDGKKVYVAKSACADIEKDLREFAEGLKD